MSVSNPPNLPTPTSLREQIYQTSLRPINDIVYVAPGMDGSVGLTGKQLDTIMSFVASYIEAAEIDARIDEVRYLSGYRQKTTEHHGGWATGVSTSRMNTRLSQLQAQKAALNNKDGGV